MVKFLDVDTESQLRNYIQVTLGNKYQQHIEVADSEFVTGLMGKDEIKEALKVRFIPAHSTVNWIEDKLITDIHKYCYKNNLRLNREPGIERDTFLGEIRYNIIYTKPDDPVCCNECKFLCKKCDINKLHYCEHFQVKEEGE